MPTEKGLAVMKGPAEFPRLKSSGVYAEEREVANRQ